MKELPIDQIVCGDCLDVMKGIPGKSIDLLVTDPPYFLPANSYVGTRETPYKRTLADTSLLVGFFKTFFESIDRILLDTGSCYIFCNAQSYPIFYQAIFPFCRHVRLLIWDKMISYNGYTWRHQHELILWGTREKAKSIPTGDGDILRCRGVLQKDRNHPAEKPIALIEQLIRKHEPTLVLDPFVGSGTTCLAAIQLNRHYIGIDISEEYCKIARRRIKQSLAQQRLPI